MPFIELPVAERTGPVSLINFSVPANDTLLVGSYDNTLLLYNCKRQTISASFKSPSPVLSVAHSSFRTTFTGHLDGAIRHVDYENMALSSPLSRASNESTDVSTGINCFRALDKTSFVATAYNGSLMIFDPRSLKIPHFQPTLLKIFAMDASNNLITLGKASLMVEIYDSRNLNAPLKVRSTGLRFQVTNLRNFPSGEAYALSGIDGRVSVEYYEDLAETQAKNFAFKCHRSSGKEASEDIVYPVTGLHFHPQYSTLFTAGGDGNVCLWNWASRKRMKLFAHNLQHPRAISHMDVSSDLACLAISVADDSYSRAKVTPGPPTGKNRVFIRPLSEAECKPKK